MTPETGPELSPRFDNWYGWDFLLVPSYLSKVSEGVSVEDYVADGKQSRHRVVLAFRVRGIEAGNLFILE